MGNINVYGTCMIKGCDKAAGADIGKFRGLCLDCYSRAKQKVQLGEVTWDRLVKLGLCLPESDPFEDAYSRALREE